MSLTSLLSPSHLVSAYGLIGISIIIFAETGLLIGFFFPGDSLLFLAGAFAATSKPGQPHLQLIPLLVVVGLAAVIGGQVGFFIGRFLDRSLLERPGQKFIKQRYVNRTREVLERYGEFKSVLLARVIPIVRTFINPVVGALGMDAKRFLMANILGGLTWAIGVTLLGYVLGSAINIDKYLLPITGLIVVASAVPVVREILKNRRPT
jgi:membrane-associated protein